MSVIRRGRSVKLLLTFSCFHQPLLQDYPMFQVMTVNPVQLSHVYHWEQYPRQSTFCHRELHHL